MRLSVLLCVALFATACSSGTDLGPATSAPSTTAPDVAPSTPEADAEPPPPPEVPEGPPSDAVLEAVDRVLEDLYTEEWDFQAIGELRDLGDARVGWLLADLMRFYQSGAPDIELVWAFSQLTGAPQDPSQVAFVWATNHLLAWDLPAWDGYAEAKSRVFAPIEPTWQQFFDEDRSVDWRSVTWGGVRADTRPLGDNGACNCIPALDHPDTTDAAGGDWYDDSRIVFGIVVGDESVALPKHQMEVHEMVNMTLGGRELGIPYCTLCGSAQAYFVDDVEGVERLVLRTSGLLRRSNKLMYDLTTGSAIDTFTGIALTGSLADAGVVLDQVSVVASTWGDWKRAHPDTRILASDGGIGRTYRDDPLGDRDAAGPIFPIGEVDPRLPVQEKVVGVITADGTPIAFPVTATREALASGPFQFNGLTVEISDSIRVYDSEGDEVVSHESFWFAWSQFHPSTLVWSEFGS